MKISGSLLSMRDNLEYYINKVNNSTIDYIHLDIMDIDFVENYSYTEQEIETILKLSNKPIDVHLMVKDINKYLKILKSDKIRYITIHYEILDDIEILNIIRKDHKVGLSLKPNTPIEQIYKYLPYIDLVLIMSVEPGKGGQQFIFESLNKVQLLKEEIIRQNYNIEISIDGGINDSNISQIKEKGVDIIVIGTYLEKLLLK